MRDKLRRRYQVQKEVTRNGYFEGEIPVSDLPRLQEMLYREPDGGRVRVEFEFVRSDYDIPMIQGQLDTSLELECQRCLKAMEMPMRLEFNLLIDAGDELLRDSSLDTLYSDDGYIDLFEVVEDELILAIPLVAMHDDSSCNEHLSAVRPDSAPVERESPFAVLRQLKTTETTE